MWYEFCFLLKDEHAIQQGEKDTATVSHRYFWALRAISVKSA